MSYAAIRRAWSSERKSQEERRNSQDERKGKRMISNRESARRSRMRKQQHLDDLTSLELHLKHQNSHITMQTNLVMQRFNKLESQNAILRAQLSELAKQLHSMNSILGIVQEANIMAMNIPEKPEHLLKPWQLPCTVQSIVAKRM